jgi:Pin2-interacting protein X1
MESSVGLLSTASKTKKLHYHKHLKSKDLSMKSDDDLACVFGKRKRKRTEDGEERQSVPGDDDNGSTRLSQVTGITTINSDMTLQEYFDMKRKNVKDRKLYKAKKTKKNKKIKN